MSTPWEQFPQIRTHVQADSGSKDDDGWLDTNKQLFKLLKDVQEKQNEYLALKRNRWKSIDYSRIARSLLEQPGDMWPRLRSLHVCNCLTDRSDISVGEEFFTNLLNLEHIVDDIRKELAIWVTDTARTNIAALVDLTKRIDEGSEVQLPWAKRYLGIRKGAYGSYVIHAKLSTNFDHPFIFQPHLDGEIADHEGGSSIQTQPACGKFVHLTVGPKFMSIALEDALGILCFSRTEHLDHSRLLDSHIRQWRERLPTDLVLPIERCSAKVSYIASVAMIYQMRCFVVAHPGQGAGPMKPPEPALRCLRDEVTFRGFYGDSRIRLVEERYTTFLHMLPVYVPVGHFGLLTISDQNNPHNLLKHHQKVSENSLFDGIYANCPDPEDQVPWRRYGLELAGLCTGVSMFQFQICIFIDTWETNWSHTIKCIDEMVILKLETLDDDSRLRRLVLENDDDAAVLYFKVLQSLNFFSDTIRSAESYIDDVSAASSHELFRHDWSNDETAQAKENTKEDTKRVLDYNWAIVKKRQHEASSRILQKLERTTNEVKSLQSGLFNVQSITAAHKSLQETQKSITLNRYLLVFTIVTIIFLPPTFAATFFGMDAFSLDTDQATRRLFWTVFGVLSGVTYVLSAIGLFGSHLLATKREQLVGQIRQQWEGLARRFRERPNQTRSAGSDGEA
ncbi:hypothetical protein B0I35DRAFT_442107 [Stachybotrys elegans]|uniref:Uncharacterized protein n=1 Tax=Stachybotrys elegans TaxID=80388 RepID=A0A8K0SFK0_9HYPO|nr:hypothetical protein B0I35DRAFT_442107 [Stachybotrys elegans]